MGEKHKESNYNKLLRYVDEVVVLKMSTLVFWVATLYGLVAEYRLHLQDCPA